MLTPAELSKETIVTCLRDHFGLHIADVEFLPLGADVNAAVYRAEAADGSLFFLKLKRGDFDEAAVAVPSYFHEQGIQAVMAPIKSTSDRLWVTEHGFSWVLYPFFEGQSGYRAALSDTQWMTLGESVNAVHMMVLPPALEQCVPREDYSPESRDIVDTFDAQVTTNTYDDPVAARLANFWLTKRSEIRIMVDRVNELGQALQQRDLEFVLCHADLHPGNVLIGSNGELAIVDWDAPIFAPKERDLMCFGGGLGFVDEGADEEALFYKGYGPTKIDTEALAYYRYERIVADVAAYGDQIFGVKGSKEDREEGLEQLMSQFLPNEVVEVAHRTYQNL